MSVDEMMVYLMSVDKMTFHRMLLYELIVITYLDKKTLDEMT